MIEEYCSVPSPSLRCPEVRRGKDNTVLACVKYVHHKTPCHFEPVPGSNIKTQFTCPACGYVEKE